MKAIIDKLFLATLILTTSIGCGVNQPVESKTSEVEVKEGIDISQNPFGALQKILEFSKKINLSSKEAKNKEPVDPVSFKELIEYLPKPPQGWRAEKPSGQTNSLGGYSISQVDRAYSKGNKSIKVSIYDWAFNSALYTPFLLATEFSQESTEGYNKGIKIGDIPGREEYTYASQTGSLNLLVNSRFLVQIDGNNIEDTELREWWQRMDRQSLTKIN